MAKVFLVCVFALLIELACGQKIISPPDDDIRTVGETAEFHCWVEFGPIPTISWEFNGGIIYSMETKGENYPAGNKKYLVTHDEGNFTLWVKDVDMKDGGIYTCSAMIPSAHATLVVLDIPQITLPRHDIVEGQAAKYICVGQFSGPSKENIPSGQYPQLQMFFAGVTLNGTVPVEEGNCTGSGNCLEFTQVFTKVLEASDNGKEVMCQIGISSPPVYLNSSTEVTVLYSVRNVTYIPKREQYRVGTQINCKADGNPAPTFTWDDRVTGNSVNGQTLEITEQMLDNNTWKCTAINSIGDVQHQKSIVVMFEAVIEDATSKDLGNGSSKTGVALGVTIPVCLIVILLAIFFCIKRQKLHKKRYTEVPAPGPEETPKPTYIRISEKRRRTEMSNERVYHKEKDAIPEKPRRTEMSNERVYHKEKDAIPEKPWRTEMSNERVYHKEKDAIPEKLWRTEMSNERVYHKEKDAVRLLKKDGDYLIIDDDGGNHYKLCVQWDSKQEDVPIEYNNKKWKLNKEQEFDSISDLVSKLQRLELNVHRSTAILKHAIMNEDAASV